MALKWIRKFSTRFAPHVHKTFAITFQRVSKWCDNPHGWRPILARMSRSIVLSLHP